MTDHGTTRQRGRDVARMLERLSAWLCAASPWLLCIASHGCNREPEGRFAQHDEPSAPVGPWRYAETIAKARRPGEPTVTLLELASPASARMRAIVAVAPPGGAPAIEIWTFDQRNEAGVLEPSGERQPGLRLRGADPRSPAIAEVLVERAAPGAQVHRERGIVAGDAAGLLATLRDAAIVVRDDNAAPEARLEAIATVVRGLDDGPLLEQDVLGRAIDELASGAWAPVQTRMISERRIEVTTSGGTVLEVHRTGDGLVIAALSVER